MSAKRGLLLDTNHLSAILTPNSLVSTRIYQSLAAGIRVGTCVPALCELEVGIRQTQSPEKNRKVLDLLLKRIRIWPIDRTIVESYGEIYADLRSRGRVLSQVDMMLAAMARGMQLTLLTSDRDFEAFSDIDVQDWPRQA